MKPFDGQTYTHPELPGRTERTCYFRDDREEWWHDVPLTRDYTGDSNPNGPVKCTWPHLIKSRMSGPETPLPTYQECPSGWYPFGFHAGWDRDDMPERLEFSEETDEALMPLWERPLIEVEDGRFVPIQEAR